MRPFTHLKKFIYGSVLAAASTGLAFTAQAADEVWSDWLYISSLQTTLQTTTFVIPANNVLVTCGSGSGQVDTYPKLVYSEESSTNNLPQSEFGGFDRVYASLMTSMVSNREVRFLMAPSVDGNHCYISQIKMR